MTERAETSRPRRSIPGRLVAGGLLLALLVAMAVSTTYVSASAPVPGEQEKFDPAAFGKDNYASKVKPAIEKDPVDLATLAPLLVKDAAAAGEQYGKRQGTSPYTYSVTLTGTAGKPKGGLMPITVPGLPELHPGLGPDRPRHQRHRASGRQRPGQLQRLREPGRVRQRGDGTEQRDEGRAAQGAGRRSPSWASRSRWSGRRRP